MNKYILLLIISLCCDNILSQSIDYETQIQPIFDNNCILCHSGLSPSSGLDLTSYENVMAGNNDGPIITIGDYENSIIWQEVSTGDMPNDAANNNLGIPDLTEAEVQLISDWILDLQCMLIDCVEWTECILGECVCINDVNENGICDENENEIAGCMNEEACNYNPAATIPWGIWPDCGEITNGTIMCCIIPGDACSVWDVNGELIIGFFDENCECIEETTSIQESNTSKKLIKVIDLLGRNIPFQNEDIILLYIYDDGTIEKVKHIK